MKVFPPRGHRVIEALLRTRVGSLSLREKAAMRRIHRLRTGYTARTQLGRDIIRLSISEEMGQDIFALIRSLRPEICLELGTGMGISTLYIVAALSLNRLGKLWSLDADGQRLALAGAHVASLKSRVPVHFVRGEFQQTFRPTLQKLGRIDFAFTDGDHFILERLPELLKALRPTGLLVYDDIRRSPGLTRAWKHIRRHPEVGLTIDCGRFGIVVPREKMRRLADTRPVSS